MSAAFELTKTTTAPRDRAARAWAQRARSRLRALAALGAGGRGAAATVDGASAHLQPGGILAARSGSGEADRAAEGRDVVAEVRAVERKEFDKVVAAYQNKVYNLIYRLINDEEEALDLTQDTFINAYRAFQRFRGDASIYTWLYRIAVNRTKNRLKQRSRQQAFEGTSLDAPVEAGAEGVEREVEDWSLAPERFLENEELGRQVDELVALLPSDFREVVVLRDYQQLSYREIADIVGISVKAVKSRLFRARSVLRHRLDRYLSAED